MQDLATPLVSVFEPQANGRANGDGRRAARKLASGPPQAITETGPCITPPQGRDRTRAMAGSSHED
eukprot:15482145-Alexandrium_andersonii.AAC.1